MPEESQVHPAPASTFAEQSWQFRQNWPKNHGLPRNSEQFAKDSFFENEALAQKVATFSDGSEISESRPNCCHVSLAISAHTERRGRSKGQIEAVE